MGCVAGVLFRREPPDPARVTAMLEASPHRGRDTRVISLGHAVLGVAEGDGIGVTQAFAGDGIHVVFSGFLDNLHELEGEVTGGADQADGSGPAGLIATLWAQGRNVPALLRGAFHAVVTDGRTLWAFRDQVGWRPLFFRAEPRFVLVGSEPKQVIAGAGIPFDPDLEMLESIFYGRTEPPERVALRGVERLVPAHLLTARSNDTRPPRVDRYWFPESYLETGHYTPDQIQERFDELWMRAVDRCLTGSDSISLSGGVDSPAIAAYAAPGYRERYGRPLHALSAVFPDHPAVDESKYIRAVADELGLVLDTYESSARPTDGLREWVRLADGPGPFLSLADVHQHRTLAAELGYRNILSGEMAEAVFDESTHLLGHLVTHGRLGAAWRYLAQGRAAGESGYGQTRRVLRMFIPMPLRRWRWERKGHRLSPSLERHRPLWLDPARLNPSLPVNPRVAWRDRQLSPLIAATTAYEADDVVHSLTGVSGRRPWADIDLWEFFLSLPAQVKFPRRGRKTLVKKLLRGRVPAVILDRRDKTVFDDAMLDRIDYAALESWLIDPDGYRMSGVDYPHLAERLRSRDLDMWEYMWAKDLAAVHAFLSLC